MNKLVAGFRPVAAHGGVTDVMLHPAGPWGEQRYVRSALALLLQLSILDGVTNLVV
jgi:hypothetical protein